MAVISKQQQDLLASTISGGFSSPHSSMGGSSAPSPDHSDFVVPRISESDARLLVETEFLFRLCEGSLVFKAEGRSSTTQLIRCLEAFFELSFDESRTSILLTESTREKRTNEDIARLGDRLGMQLCPELWADLPNVIREERGGEKIGEDEDEEADEESSSSSRALPCVTILLIALGVVVLGVIGEYVVMSML